MALSEKKTPLVQRPSPRLMRIPLVRGLEKIPNIQLMTIYHSEHLIFSQNQKLHYERAWSML